MDASHMSHVTVTALSTAHPVTGLSTALKSHPDIHHLGLLIHLVLKLFVCQTCKIAMTGDNIGNHLHSFHEVAAGCQVDTSKIRQIINEYDLLQEMPVINGPIPQVEGLLFFKDCVKCPKCDSIYSRESLRMHYSRDHPGMINFKVNDLPGIFAQQLNKGANKKLFEVIPCPTPTTPISSPQDIIQHLRSERDDLIQTYHPKEIDARAVSPWLLATSWHIHTQPYNAEELCKLIAIPKNEGRLDKLGSAVQSILNHAYSIMTVTSTLVLQKINTSDPVKDGINNVPLKPHQRPDTLKEYGRTCVQLLAMLFRIKDAQYKLPLPPKVAASRDRLWTALGTDDDLAIKRATNDLLFRLWTKKWHKSKENTIGDPTICLLALAMLKPDGSFRSPVQTTPYIAKLIYCLRLVFLIAINKSNGTQLCETQSCDLYSSWFTEKVDSTFNTLCTLQHHASALAYSETSMPRIVWTDRTTYRTMRYKGTPIPFNGLQKVFSKMEEDIVKLWENDVLMQLPLQVRYDQLFDDLSNTTVDYSFISDKRNQCFGNRDMLAKAIIEHPILYERFFSDENGVPTWNIMALQKWLFNYAKFHSIQLASIEMKAGSPGRGTELCCLEYRNTPTRPQRGLYIMGTHVAVVCQYHKSGSITGKDKVIPHSLDAVTSDLVVQDLLIARPFAELAAYVCYPHNQDIQSYYNSYLFVNNKSLFTTTDITNVLKTYTLPVYDVGLGVNDWRHISAAFRRKICPGLEDIIEDDSNQETIQALQSGHTRQTENRIYGISTEALAGSADEVLPMFLDASTDWQVACRVVPGGHLLPYSKARMESFDQLSSNKAIKSNYSTPISTMEQALDRVISTLNSSFEAHTETLLTKLEPKLEQMIEKIVNRLASSSQAATPGIIAPPSMPTPPASMISLSHKKLPNDDAPQLTNCSNISLDIEQHSFGSPLISPSQSLEDFDDEEIKAKEPLKEGITKLLESNHQDADVKNQNQSHQAADIVQVTDIDIASGTLVDPSNVDNTITANMTDEQVALHILRRLTNNSNATWKSQHQLQAIKEVLEMSNDILLIMATGGGKTMVAIIPTLVDNNVSIIVLPLISLITDYKRKFDTMGIKYDHYTSSTTALRRDVNFIFVSADMAKTASWRECIMDLNDHVDIARLFFDEAHLPLLNHDFRPALNHLSDLRVLSIQFILLTGTAPPSSEKALYTIFGLNPSKTITLRSPTDRPELNYNILPHAHTYNDALILVKDTLATFNSLRRPGDAALLFVPYIDIGERLSKDLGCAFYSGQIRDSTQREQIYLSWYNGNNSTLVATSALSLGNDHPSVQLIIHFGTPLEMMSYVQEVSRGGRTGRPAMCILIPMSKRVPKSELDEDYTGINAMNHYVWKEKGCARHAITLFFDGHGVYCQNRPGCIPCKHCHKAIESHQSAVIRPCSIIQSSPDVPPYLEPISRKRKSIGKATAFDNQLCAAKKSKTERTLDLLNYVEVFKSCLAIFQSSCVYCLVFKKPTGYHELFKCPGFRDKISEYRTWKQSIRYDPRYPNKSCWFCHLPQCGDQLHPAFTTPKDCDYPDIVAPIAFAIFQIGECRQKAENHFEVQWPSIEAFTKWLVGPPHKNEQTNISALFLWYALGYFSKL